MGLTTTATGPEIDCLSDEQIDSNNVHGLILLLGMPANFSRIKLNLSSSIDQQLLKELLKAVDALSHAPEVHVEIDGKSDGRIEPRLCLALAGSKACLSTSAVRSWIIENFIQTLGDKNIADRLQADLHMEQQGGRFANILTEKQRQLFATHRSIEIAALRAAAGAIAAFLANKGCPGTGRPIADADAHALGRIALYYGDPVLQLAIRKLAPHCKLEFLRIPENAEIQQLGRFGVPCEFNIGVTSQSVNSLSTAMKLGGPLFNDMTLTLTESLEPAQLQKFYQSINDLAKVDRLTICINPELSLDLGQFMVTNKNHERELLILEGAERAYSDATVHLTYLAGLLDPYVLSIRAGTPGAAAYTVAELVKNIQQGEPSNMKELNIHCSLHSVPEEPSLVEAISELLEVMGDDLVKIAVQTQEPLITNEDQKNNFIQLAHAHMVSDDIRFDYLSSLSNDWRNYIHIKFSPDYNDVAGIFFSHHLQLPQSHDGLSRAFPSNIGRYAADLALSQDDLEALALVSRATASTASRAWTRHTASVIVFELKHDGFDASELRAWLSPKGELDQALVNEVHAQLSEQAVTEGAWKLLNEVAPLKDA